MSKILIVQFRTNETEAHDQGCFRKRLVGRSEELVFINGIREELPESLDDDVVAVMLGGSGEFYLTKGDGEGGWRDDALSFIDMVIESGTPLLGLCFGFQLIALREGARFVSDESMQETGTYRAQLLPGAENDPIFSQLEHEFDVPLAHKDTAVHFPDSVIPLVRTQAVDVEAFRLAGKDVWAALFHAEMSHVCMGERLKMSPEYMNDDSGVEEYIKEHFTPTPEAEKVIRLFIEYAQSKK